MAPLKQRSSVDPLHRETPKLNILLTNGRFPVALDLARQLHQAGHTVYCVDPRGYPIARFSRAVEASAQTPAPHDNPDGYLSAIKKLVVLWKIDMIVPVHEELLSLADSDEPEILSRLFAPSFKLLLRLHEKYSFTKYMHSLGLAVPTAWLCKSMDDVINLPTEKFPGGLALRPCLGEAAQDSYHLRSGEPLPELDIGEHKWYVAQELISGIRYCSYSIVRKGSLEATGVYPVLDTVDHSSTVYFRQKFHPQIYDYIHKFVSSIPAFSGQIALDFIDTADGVVAIECKPHATSGVHLWCNTPWLARAITGSLPTEYMERPIRPPRKLFGHESHHQVAAGMLMFPHEHPSILAWAKQMKRLIFTRDVVWNWKDPMPTIAQPFLLTEYYRMARRSGLQLSASFQQQLSWDLQGAERDRVLRLLDTAELQDCAVDTEHNEIDG